jgi:hypothetical protein
METAKLVLKVTMYPTKEELRGAVESYLTKNHPDFYGQFSETRWTAYFNKIQKHVSS